MGYETYKNITTAGLSSLFVIVSAYAGQTIYTFYCQPKPSAPVDRPEFSVSNIPISFTPPNPCDRRPNGKNIQHKKAGFYREIWCQNNAIDRTDGPAKISHWPYMLVQSWHKAGKLYRADGPHTIVTYLRNEEGKSNNEAIPSVAMHWGDGYAITFDMQTGQILSEVCKNDPNQLWQKCSASLFSNEKQRQANIEAEKIPGFSLSATVPMLPQ